MSLQFEAPSKRGTQWVKYAGSFPYRDLDEASQLTDPSGPPDFDNGGTVGILDLLMLLASWGPCPAPCPLSCTGDLSGDCVVDPFDLAAVGRRADRAVTSHPAALPARRP